MPNDKYLNYHKHKLKRCGTIDMCIMDSDEVYVDMDAYICVYCGMRAGYSVHHELFVNVESTHCEPQDRLKYLL